MTAGFPELAGRTVLVIEDESLVTMLIEDSLADLGCDVVGSASRFDEAIGKARELLFDVAILDVNLSGEQTFPIAETLSKRGIPFVWATGYGEVSLPESVPKAPVLTKPFQQRDLARVLRQALLRGRT